MHAERGQLLHNMSVPPRSQIAYGGLDAIKSSASKASNRKRRSEPEQLAIVSFSIPKPRTVWSIADALSALGIAPGDDAEETLRHLVDETAERLPMPAACVVAPATSVVPEEDRYSDLLVALAVLAKCSENIWVRGKFPSLVAAFERRFVCLYLSPSQRDLLRSHTR
jgi:hypothetical protein